VSAATRRRKVESTPPEKAITAPGSSERIARGAELRLGRRGGVRPHGASYGEIQYRGRLPWAEAAGEAWCGGGSAAIAASSSA
jgi:hypothetical protein